ncbi:DUF4270 family protein [Proteiniphilum sp.]|uniref:DUF4270 family protein n=1 Tax=Proteiniphilum sp. TaxID=1926877 RepID=UPI002B1F7A5B|nr:DUF4270 family protein [Proteiniphilum sp.]MEA4918234.1 DUF4270 family protein [Proteiniphilum sp.]
MKFASCFLLCFLFFASCISDHFSVGDNLVSVKGRNMIIEDCTVELESHLGDSSVTTGLSRIFEGRYHSPDFGVITAHSYFDFNPPSYSLSEFAPDAITTVIFDSITLILRYDNFSYGDTTQIQTMNIYKLQQIIELDGRNQLYTTSSVPVGEDPWVTYKFHRPAEHWENDTLLELRLPDEFGLELVNLMKTQSDLLKTYDNFRTYFKGIKLSPGVDDNAAVNSFVINNEYPIIRIYYTTIEGITTEERKLDMTVNSTTAFSQIETDRSETLLYPLGYNNSLPSAETDHKVYLQGLTGLYTKLSFPDLNEILKLGKHIIISSAILYVYPVLGTYDDFTPLPTNLSLNYLDENGKAIDIYVDPSTTTVQSGTLVEDKVYNKNTYYVFDVTSYLQYELGMIGMYKSSLQLFLDDTDKNNTLKSLVLGDSSFSNEENRIKLIIQVVIYDRD